MNRRDLLLQEMGITQWQVRRPNVLKGAVNVPVSHQVRLIVIAEQALSLQTPFMQDLLRSLALQPEECLLIDFDHAQHLNVQHPVHYWLLSKNSEKTDRTFALLNDPTCPLWRTGNFTQLTQSAVQKRELWRQIQHSFQQSV